MELIKMMAGVYAANCYLLSKEGDLAIIDPGGDFDDIVKKIEENKLYPRCILLTHGHGDHIGAVNQLKEKYAIPVYAGKREEELLGNPEYNVSRMMPSGDISVRADKLLQEGSVIELKGLEIRVIECPGHTGGGLSFLVDGHIFTGDTLFKGSIGRTDLYSSDYSEIKKSLKKLISLDEKTVVHPGHGSDSTIAEEIKTNRFLKDI